MSTDEPCLSYVRNAVYLIRERAAEAAEQRGLSGTDFEEGREFGLRQALSILQNQADAFGIPRRRLCLADFEPMHGPIAPPLSSREGETK